MIRRAQVILGLAALVGAAFAASSAGQGPPGGSPPGLDKAIAAKQKHAERLLDKPGVAGIGVGLNPAGKPVIRIYKEKPDVADLPDELEEVPVESLTTGVLAPRDHLPTHRFPRPVPIGVSSGLSGVATGTLGARVTDGTNTYALSNNHVFAGINGANIGDPIISPGDVDGGSDPGDRIGTLAAYQTIDFDGGTNTMDAAIALTSSANVGTSTPADGYGLPSPITAQAFVGQAVQKYGRTTGLQLGDVVATNVSVDVCYLLLFEFCLQEARFAGQISISPGPFSAPGDSGSLVVTQGGNQPVGLLFAGGDGLTIASPIDPVLQRFGVTIDGAPPGDGPPAAPASLAALSGDASVSLSWQAPSFDGGSPVTNYKVYRGSPGSETFLANAGTATTYLDSGLVNGTSYSYRVSAVNANGEGPLSGAASATPLALVPPVQPLPTIDNFDRGFENPLSDAGRWSNGVNGGAETGLYVPSIWLACSKSTTCTSWRNSAQYGPDTEVWGRLSVLPGDANQLRLYARLTQPGTTGYDGYMLRTNQLAGTDQVLIERVDNDTFVPLKTINQELVAGDVLLLRVQGQILEAWRHDGSAWARLGFASDSTYAAAGYVGVGLRGTTGRLDDFGARTMGAPPPDTESPSAPGALSASAVSPSQIDLSWGAATDNVAVTLYRIERCEGPGCSNFSQIATTASTSYPSTGLSPSTAYSYRVRAQDAVPNVGDYTNTASATTLAPPDTEAPSAPGTLNASAFSASQIELTWQAATDNVAVVLYRIERCEGAGCSNYAEIALATSTSHMDTGLSPSTSYSYRVRAQDAVPNVGDFSNTATAATPAPPDTESPSAPGTLSASAVSPSQIDLSWGAATDNVAVTLYRIERCQGVGCANFSQIATTASTSYPNSGLSPSTAYSYRVRAQDAVPNVGDYTNTASATTLAPPDTEAPSAPGTLVATASSATQIGLSWVAATDNVAVGQYRIERCSGPSCGNFAEIATTTGTSYSDQGLTAATPYSYRVRAEDTATPIPNRGLYSNLASATASAAPRPLYFSLESSGTVGGVSAENEDIVFFTGTGTFSLAFDGSDVGLSSRRLDAFTWLDADSLLFSLDTDGAALPGAGTVDDSDVVRFDASSLGSSTSGTFSMYFDGSDVGLTTSGEDVDAFEILADGRLVLSTLDTASVPGVSGADEDLLVFTQTALGATTSGSYALYFDGSDVGLTTTNEDVDSAAVDAAGRIYLSTLGAFAVPGVSGSDQDVFVFNPTTLGATTAGSYDSALYFDGSAFGLGGNDLFTVDIP